MSILRASIAAASLGIAVILLLHFARVLRPVVLPTLRHLGQEETAFWVLRIAGVSLSGWQILLVEGIVLLLGIGFVFVAIYALTSAVCVA